ncbi:MAG: winged helix-turn-helix domain-containing protein [Methanosarcinaceae archaeon]|nr:winged helix-turn-helix domain-containing protein [Methanosarcinaceae archaeon]
MTLKDGAKEMDILLKSLKTTRQALLPQLRILEESMLIEQHDDTYELTTIGQLLVSEMGMLVDTVKVLDVDISYWGDRQLDFIPPGLLKRLNELGPCSVVVPGMTELLEINKEFFEMSKDSSNVTKVTTFLYPNFPVIYSAWIDNGLHISLIISAELFKKIKKDHAEEFRKYLGRGQMDLFVYHDEIKFLSFAHNDYCASLKLLRKSGEYDSKELLCCNSSAVEWCRELCEHYKGKSTRVADI